MEILVCIKQVPGSNKVEVDPVTGVLKRDGADSKMNPYDLYALEVGMELKEQYGGRLYEAFSMGADEGALVTDRKFGGADVLATSYTLSQGIRRLGKFDLILCGLQTTDGDTAQVGPEVSEMLGIPCVCNVNAIGAVKAGGITVTMEMSEDIEELDVSFPCLLTVQKDIMQPRLPSYKLKQATKDRKITVYTFQDMEDQDEHHYGLNGSATQVQRIFPPTSDKEQRTIEGTSAEAAQQMLALLKQKKFIA